MDAVSHGRPTADYADQVWSKTPVRLLLITGLALAALGGLVVMGLVGVPAGLLSLVGITVKHLGTGLISSGLLFMLSATIISLFARTKKTSPASGVTGFTLRPPAPAPAPNLTGASGNGGGHNNLVLEDD